MDVLNDEPLVFNEAMDQIDELKSYVKRFEHSISPRILRSLANGTLESDVLADIESGRHDIGDEISLLMPLTVLLDEDSEAYDEVMNLLDLLCMRDDTRAANGPLKGLNGIPFPLDDEGLKEVEIRYC